MIEQGGARVAEIELWVAICAIYCLAMGHRGR